MLWSGDSVCCAETFNLDSCVIGRNDIFLGAKDMVNR